MSQPNPYPSRDRVSSADALDLMNPALKDFELFKRRPAAGDAAVAVPSVSSAEPFAADEAPGIGGLAAVTVDAGGKILAIDSGCASMFGWKGGELVGQHLRAIIKDWPEAYASKFLAKSGRPDGAGASFRVTGRRIDGREFSVCLTRLCWTANGNAKAGGVPDYWTALFGEVADSSSPSPRRNEPPGSVGSTRLEDAGQFKGSTAALRSANEELQKKLEAMAVDAWKKGELVNKVEKERVELAEKLAAHDTEIAKARTDVEEQVAARKVLEAKVQEVEAARLALETQLAEQCRNADEVQSSASQLRQEINSVKLTADRAEAARQQELARADGFKTALTNLQHSHDELNAKLAADKQALAEARRRVEELESMLRGTSAEVERGNAELDKEKAVRSRVEAELRSQLSNAKLEVDRAETASKQEAARAEGFKQALSDLQRGYDELNARLTTEQVSTGELKRRTKELESLLRQSSGGTQFEAELRNQLSAARQEHERAQSAHKQEAARAARFERELAAARQELQEMDGKLTSEMQPALEWRRRAKELEDALRETNGELDRARTERVRLEAELRAQQSAPPRRGKGDTELRRAARQENTAELVELERQLRRQVEDRFNSLNNQFAELREELRRTLSQKNSPVRSGEFGPPRPDWDRKAS